MRVCEPIKNYYVLIIIISASYIRDARVGIDQKRNRVSILTTRHVTIVSNQPAVRAQ